MPNHMFAGASIATISGGTFVNHSDRSALDRLSAATAHSALHDAPARTDESRCHQHTRTNVLNQLERWAQGIFATGASIFWLYGGAGAGKSAIMQTLAERCVAQRLVLGSFFFSRNDSTRNTAEVLIATLVYQLTRLFPPALQVLNSIIEHDPLIFKKSLQVQLISLLVHPLQHLVQLGIISDSPQSPRVFLIDGLDECNDPSEQQAIIRAVAGVCHEHGIPVKFLIASRPEHVISASFELYKQANHVLSVISLSEDVDAKHDIRRFIEDEFVKIRLQHPFRRMIPYRPNNPWPGHYDINKLVWKSSSHFIYASTAMKYIWSPKESPVRSLQVVLGLEVSRTTLPFSELDALYNHIFGSAAHLDKVLQILGHCICTRMPSSARVVCIMLDCSYDDFLIFMADIAPLVAVSGEEVTLLHASLGDFLCDQSRSASLHLNSNVYLASKLDRCFQLFDLYSRQHHTEPDWPISSSRAGDRYTPYNCLQAQIIRTIRETSTHLFITRDILKRHNLRDFYECQLRFKQVDQNMGNVHVDLGWFLQAVHEKGTYNYDWFMLFRSYLEDSFDILESYISLERTPLGPTILTLLFSGYPPKAAFEILSHHGRGDREQFYSLICDWFECDTIITADLSASIRHSVNTSPERLAEAAEAILGYLLNDAKLPTYSKPRSEWLQQTKPGRYTVTGAHKNVPISKHRCRFVGLKNKYQLSADDPQRLQERLKTVVTLVKALFWLLPRAGFSAKLVNYSNRMLPWIMIQHKTSLCRRVRKRLLEYTTRVKNAKLKDLDQRIENGDVNALIEKSRMPFLDALD